MAVPTTPENVPPAKGAKLNRLALAATDEPGGSAPVEGAGELVLGCMVVVVACQEVE